MVNPFEETLQAGKVSDDYNIGRFGEFDRFQDERDVFPEAFERPQSTIGGYDEQGYTLPASEPDHWFWGYNNPEDIIQEQQRGIYPFMKRHAPEWLKDIFRGDKEGNDWTPEDELNALRKKTEVQRKKLDEARRGWDQQQMDPLYPPPGPWNEFDPHSRFEEYIDNMNIDEGGVDWSPSEEYLGGMTEVAQSQWKRPENMEKTIKSLELRPEFEGWTHDEIKYWIINQARANRGGIIGLL